MQGTLFKTLIAIAVLSGTTLLQVSAASIPRSILSRNATLEARQSYPTYTKPSATGQTNVGFQSITCTVDEGTWEYCFDPITSAIQSALNQYASVLNTWAQSGPGPYAQDYGYFTGSNNGVMATVAFANPPYFDDEEAETWLANWNSQEAALQITDYMYGQNLIQVCDEPWDWIDNVAIGGSVFIGVGWNNEAYAMSEDQGLSYFHTCNGY